MSFNGIATTARLPVLIQPTTKVESYTMHFGIIGAVVVILLVAALLQNVALGGLGGIILLVLVILLLMGRL